MTLHEIQLEFERIYAERYAYDDDMSGARLHALRAVAPMLIAAYLRKAATEMGGDSRLEKLLLARAQELDTQAGYDPTIQPYDVMNQ